MKLIMIYLTTMALASLLVLTGCDCKEPQPKNVSMAGDYEVALLFEKDGCKVYRFNDSGYRHYFTNCSETESRIPSGKTSRAENIKTSH